MTEVDLSAARAKRRREGKTLVMRGESGEILDKYDLVPEFPAEALDLGVEGKLGAALKLLFPDGEDAQAFFSKYHPSVDDLLDIMRGAYGLGGDLGES